MTLCILAGGVTGVEALLKVMNDIVDVLEADGYSDQIFGDT